MPSAESGWDVAVATHKKKDDSEEYALTGQRTFAPGQRLSRTYAAPNDPDAVGRERLGRGRGDAQEKGRLRGVRLDRAAHLRPGAEAVAHIRGPERSRCRRPRAAGTWPWRRTRKRTTPRSTP